MGRERQKATGSSPYVEPRCIGLRRMDRAKGWLASGTCSNGVGSCLIADRVPQQEARDPKFVVPWRLPGARRRTADSRASNRDSRSATRHSKIDSQIVCSQQVLSFTRSWLSRCRDTGAHGLPTLPGIAHPSSHHGSQRHTTFVRRPIAALSHGGGADRRRAGPGAGRSAPRRAPRQAAHEPVGGVAAGTTRVIVRTDRGALAPVLRLVTALGGRVLAQHKLIDALTVELPLVQLALVVRLPGVLSVSLDSPVASAPIVEIGPAESHLVETLALPEGGLLRTAPDGRGIGVGVIDSGLAATGAYQIRRFVDFTRPANGKTYTENAQPSDDYGHGTHVAGLIAGTALGSNGKYRGVAPNVRADRPEGARRQRRRPHERRHRGHRIRRRQPRRRSASRHQPVARPPDLEPAATDPLVQAVERAARAGLIVVVVGRQLRLNPQTGELRLRRHHLAGQRAVGDHGRRRSTPATPPRAATTRSRTTARAARRGTTATPSRTSSRRATGWCRDRPEQHARPRPRRASSCRPARRSPTRA